MIAPSAGNRRLQEELDDYSSSPDEPKANNVASGSNTSFTTDSVRKHNPFYKAIGERKVNNEVSRSKRGETSDDPELPSLSSNERSTYSNKKPQLKGTTEYQSFASDMNGKDSPFMHTDTATVDHLQLQGEQHQPGSTVRQHSKDKTGLTLEEAIVIKDDDDDDDDDFDGKGNPQKDMTGVLQHPSESMASDGQPVDAFPNTEKSGTLKFPDRLMYLLSKEELHPSMSWLPDGKTFTIKPDLFCKYVLPKYFQSYSQFHSFQRRLNRWGFRQALSKEGASAGTLTYTHKLFQRDKPCLCREMKMATPKKPAPSKIQKRRAKQGLAAATSTGRRNSTDVIGGEGIIAAAVAALRPPSAAAEQKQKANRQHYEETLRRGGERKIGVLEFVQAQSRLCWLIKEERRVRQQLLTALGRPASTGSISSQALSDQFLRHQMQREEENLRQQMQAARDRSVTETILENVALESHRYKLLSDAGRLPGNALQQESGDYPNLVEAPFSRRSHLNHLLEEERLRQQQLVQAAEDHFATEAALARELSSQRQLLLMLEQEETLRR